MKATKAVLAEMKKIVKGIPKPKAHKYKEDPNAESSYNLHFTHKQVQEPADIKYLKNYEITHAIYYYNAMVDTGVPEKITKGKFMLIEIFDVFDVFDVFDCRGMNIMHV